MALVRDFDSVSRRFEISLPKALFSDMRLLLIIAVSLVWFEYNKFSLYPG